jgi:hypothetical protein
VKFILGLLALEESGQFKDLGYPTVWLYSEVFFKQRRSETFEMLRVARALRTLPLCRRAFETGAFSWSVLRAITRIAKPHTELRWIEFADKKSPEAIEAEVTDAIDKNRDLPRGRRYGLPGLKKSFTFRVTPTQGEVLEKALRKVAGEMRGG